jgi:hypothetical protein
LLVGSKRRLGVGVEGADIVMVKPALPQFDLIRRIKDDTAMPVAAAGRERRLQRHLA